MRILQQNQQTLALPGQSETNPVTGGFTETFTEGFSRHSRVHFKRLIFFASGSTVKISKVSERRKIARADDDMIEYFDFE